MNATNKALAAAWLALGTQAKAQATRKRKARAARNSHNLEIIEES